MEAEHRHVSKMARHALAFNPATSRRWRQSARKRRERQVPVKRLTHFSFVCQEPIDLYAPFS